jgi:hypothetical protein
MQKTLNIGYSITNKYLFTNLLKYILTTWVYFKSALSEEKRREYMINFKFTKGTDTAVETHYEQYSSPYQNINITMLNN